VASIVGLISKVDEGVGLIGSVFVLVLVATNVWVGDCFRDNDGVGGGVMVSVLVTVSLMVRSLEPVFVWLIDRKGLVKLRERLSYSVDERDSTLRRSLDIVSLISNVLEPVRLKKNSLCRNSVAVPVNVSPVCVPVGVVVTNGVKVCWVTEGDAVNSTLPE